MLPNPLKKTKKQQLTITEHLTRKFQKKQHYAPHFNNNKGKTEKKRKQGEKKVANYLREKPYGHCIDKIQEQ